jgi:hypothetical protein
VPHKFKQQWTKFAFSISNSQRLSAELLKLRRRGRALLPLRGRRQYPPMCKQLSPPDFARGPPRRSLSLPHVFSTRPRESLFV